MSDNLRDRIAAAVQEELNEQAVELVRSLVLNGSHVTEWTTGE